MDVLVDTNQMLIPFPWARRQRKWWGMGPSRYLQKTGTFWKEPGPWLLLTITSVLCLKPGHGIWVGGLGGIPERILFMKCSDATWTKRAKHTHPRGGINWSEGESICRVRKEKPTLAKFPWFLLIPFPRLCLNKHSQANVAQFVVLRYFFLNVYYHVFLVDGVLSS